MTFSCCYCVFAIAFDEGHDGHARHLACVHQMGILSNATSMSTCDIYQNMRSMSQKIPADE